MVLDQMLCKEKLNNVLPSLKLILKFRKYFFNEFAVCQLCPLECSDFLKNNRTIYRTNPFYCRLKSDQYTECELPSLPMKLDFPVKTVIRNMLRIDPNKVRKLLCSHFCTVTIVYVH